MWCAEARPYRLTLQQENQEEKAMSEQGLPPENGETSTPPSDQIPGTTDPVSAPSPQRGLMIVLSYLWILCLVPLLVEKDDREVQWHAKHGLIITVAELFLQIILYVVSSTLIGCVFAIFIPLVFLALACVRLYCIVKGVGGERVTLPLITQYADKF